MKPTLKKLKELEDKLTGEKERVRLAVKHGLCPECGKKLKDEYKEGRGIWFFRNWERKISCPVNEEHYKRMIYPKSEFVM